MIKIKVTTISARPTNGINGSTGGGGPIITSENNDHHHIGGGGGANNMSYSFHGSGSVVLGGAGGMAGPGSGLGGGSGMIGPPPEGYVSANVFSVRIILLYIIVDIMTSYIPNVS